MRRLKAEQPPLMREPSTHERAKILTEVSRILDSMPELAELVHGDLTRGLKHPGRGRDGLTAEQVLRLLVLRRIEGLSFEALAFLVEDSATYAAFCRIGRFDGPMTRSRLHANVERVTAETIEQINRALVLKAKKEGIESGEKTRGDTTVAASNIHPPTDSWMLWDLTRVLTRLLGRAAKTFGVAFTDHTAEAKSKHVAIAGAANEEQRLPLYHELVPIAQGIVADAQRVTVELASVKKHAKLASKLVKKVTAVVEPGLKVIDQTIRRVFDGKKVPSPQKVVSIFETHTDIIVKDRQHVYYGHKVALTTGASGLILDCIIEKGNPGDVTLAVKMIDRQTEIYGRAPKQVAFDGGFASRENLDAAKARGVKDVVFSKGRGLTVAEMVRRGSNKVYRGLRNFRAAIEGGISVLKRRYGLGRARTRGWEHFKAHVWGAAMAANLVAIARCRLDS